MDKKLKKKKVHIISMRVTDEDRAAVQKVQDVTDKGASAVMRVAFQALLAQYLESSRQAA